MNHTKLNNSIYNNNHSNNNLKTTIKRIYIIYKGFGQFTKNLDCLKKQSKKEHKQKLNACKNEKRIVSEDQKE